MPKAIERRSNDVEEPDAAWARRLRARYSDIAEEPLPENVRELLEQLAAVDARRRQN